MKSPLKRFGVMVLTAMALVYSFEGSAQKLTTQHRSTDQNVGSGQLVQANSNSAADLSNPTASDNVSPFDAVKGKKEDTRKRDAFSKHFINEDGSFTALIGAGPIHYEKNGQFLDISPTITASSDFNYPFANTSNLFESYFGATSHTGIKNKTAEGEIKEFLNTKMYWEVNGQAVNIQNSANKSVRVEGEKAYYDNIYGTISAEFTMQTGKRKLNYIIPNRQAMGISPAGANYLVFTEDVVLPFGWTSQVTESGVVIQDQLGKEIYLYENPVSTDAVMDELQAQGNTIFETYQIGNTLTIKTKVKTAWLLSNERQFPVMVDPTFTQTIAGASETGRVQSNGAGAYGIIRFGQQSSLWVLGYISYNLVSWNPSWIATDVSIVLSGTSNGTIHASSRQQIQRVTVDPAAYATWASYYTAQNGMTFYGEYTGAGNFAGTKNLGATAVTQFTSDVGTAYKKFTVGFRAGGTWNNNSYINWTTATLNVTYTESSTPPSCPTNISPVNGSTGAAHQGSLVWSSVSGATSYDVYFGNTATPPLVSTSQTGTSYAITECLLPSTTYYWRVIPKNASGSATGCAVWSFTTDNKLHIYQNNFETASLGFFGTSGGTVDGWNTNNNAGTGGTATSGYNNTWTVGNGVNAISGNSVGVSALYNGGLAGNYFQYYGDLGEIHRWIYRPFDMRGLRDIEVSFRWKAGGELNQDYGSVISSINGGGNWLMDDQGGLNNDGRYWNSPSTIRNQTIIFPETRNNQQNFVLGFKWDDWSGNGVSTDPSFVVDDIVVKACPYEGDILSDEVDPGVYEWIPTGSTETILTIDGSHACAQYEWEQSIDNGATWTIISGAITDSYTTPSDLAIDTWYRSRVYFGTGCPGVYQEEPFKIIFPIDKPESLIFHNYGGSEQLTFNNSRIDTTTPIFRLSHETHEADSYQIEINISPDFTGTSWTQTFSGVFPIDTEANFTFNNGFTPANNITYYVRARAKGITNVYSDWTTETYSFTYQTPKDIPDWFQTTQAQFASNTLSGVMASPSHDVVTQNAGNAIANGSFENGTTGWTKYILNAGNYPHVISTTWSTEGSNSLRIYNGNPGGFGYMSADRVIITQNVDLTNVSNLLLDARYSGSTNIITQLRVYVTETNQASSLTGTLLETWTPGSNGAITSINVDVSSFSGSKAIQLVYWVTGNDSTSGSDRSFYVDNVRTTSLPTGTITSTPIHLASVQGATAYEGITWNQTLAGGEFKLKVQQSPDGISGWTDVSGYDNISETGDGEKSFDLSGMTPYEHILLVGSLDGANVVLHDWSVQFQAEELDCSVETIWNGSSWSQNVPDGSTYKIIFEGDYNSSADANYPATTGLMGCSVEVRGDADVVIASGHSLTIDNEIVVDNANGATFTVKSDANLVQVNAGVENAGNIIVERSAVVPSVQYNFWTSPVKEQMLYSLYPGILAGKVMRYNTQTNYFNAIPANSKSEFAKGYSIRGSSLSEHAPNVTANFIGVPQNESLDAAENEIALLRVSQRFNLIGNPFPSNLDLQKLNTNVSNAGKIENSTFYFWDNADNTAYNQQGNNYVNQNYAMYNASFGEGTAAPRFATGGKKPNGIVKPGQGFIVQATSATTGGLVFTNDMRTKEIKLNAGDDDAVYFKNVNNGAVDDIYGSRPRKDKFWLELVNPADMHIQIAVGYFKEAENTLDTYDSKILSEGVSDNLYSLSEDAHKLTIQGREGPFADTDVIPLGVKFFVQGKYKIQLEDTKGIFKNHQHIYLKDKHLNQIHNLSESFYDFEGTPGVFEDRFEIIFKDESQISDPVLTTASDNHLKIIKKDRQIEISSSRDKILEVEIFNLSGWSIYKNEKVNSKALQIPASLFGKQIIVVKVLTETGEIETKKIINK